MDITGVASDSVASKMADAQQSANVSLLKKSLTDASAEMQTLMKSLPPIDGKGSKLDFLA